VTSICIFAAKHDCYVNTIQCTNSYFFPNIDYRTDDDDYDHDYNDDNNVLVAVGENLEFIVVYVFIEVLMTIDMLGNDKCQLLYFCSYSISDACWCAIDVCKLTLYCDFSRNLQVITSWIGYWLKL